MEKFINGIYQMCNDAQPVILAVLVVMILIAGLSTIIGGEESRGRLKETIKYILYGAALSFCATTIGKQIASWFM